MKFTKKSEPKLRVRANFKVTARGEIQPDITVEFSDVGTSIQEIESVNNLIEIEIKEVHKRLISTGKQLGYRAMED